MLQAPKFLENKDWYTESVDSSGSTVYALTDKAPTEAVESFKRYYSIADDKVFHDDEGNTIDLSDYEIDY